MINIEKCKLSPSSLDLGKMASWGDIHGDINDQKDLIEKIQEAGGVSKSYVDGEILRVEGEVDEKQNILIPGDNITIEGNVISASGGVSKEYVDGEIARVEGEIPSLTNYATKQWVSSRGYLTEHQPIKTINGESLVGTGDITIDAGGQKYNEVATKADRDLLDAHEGDVAVVANDSINIFNLEFINNINFNVERGIEHTVNVDTSYNPEEWIYFSMGYFDTVEGRTINIQFDYQIGEGYRIYNNDTGNWDPWDGTPVSFVVPDDSGAYWNGMAGGEKLLTAFSIIKTHHNVPYVYQGGEWTTSVDKAYVDAKAVETRDNAVSEAVGQCVGRINWDNPEGSLYRDKGQTAYNNGGNFWIKTTGGYTTYGWKELDEFNKDYTYANNTARDADDISKFNGNTCTVLGESTGTEFLSIMSVQTLNNPQEYIKTGKTYQFSTKVDSMEDTFIWSCYSYGNGNYQYFGVMYDSDGWHKLNGTEPNWEDWDGTPFDVTISGPFVSIWGWSGDLSLMTNCFDIKAHIPVYGNAKRYIYEDGWKESVDKDWVVSQGYLTEHQSLAGYATESWVNQQLNGVEDITNEILS